MACTPDFQYLDFDSRDFEVGVGHYFNFREYFFDLLPRYFKRYDTYKNHKGQGLLERYLTVFGTELDEHVIPEIECYLEIIDASITDSKYLGPIAKSLGNPPDIFQDDKIYRNLLQYIVTFYKIKGTAKSYELFFAILGFAVEVEELPYEEDGVFYDLEGEYDTGLGRYTYDRNSCLICYYYNIKIRPLDESQQLVISTSTLNKLRDAIAFNEPINSRLASFTSTLDIQGTLTVPTGTTIGEIKNMVNITRAKGNFGSADAPIEDARYNQNNTTMVYSSTFKEEDFDGRIQSVELRNTENAYLLENQTGLNITKDNRSRIRVNWYIKITYN